MVRHCLWKMSATPGACIKPGLVRRPLCHKVNLPSCVAWRPLYHRVNLPICVARQPLCHKVNLPSCVAWRPLYHRVNLPICVARQPLCQKVNLPRYEARRRYLIMTCDIFGTGQTNTLILCYLLGKTYKPLSRHWNQHARPNNWKSYWREPHRHSIEGFDRVGAKFEFRCESF